MREVLDHIHAVYQARREIADFERAKALKEDAERRRALAEAREERLRTIDASEMTDDEYRSECMRRFKVWPPG